MAIIEVKDNDFNEKVLENNKMVLCDFWAEWCGPCKQIAPILEEISQNYSHKLDVAKINIDENPEIPTKFSIKGIPTLILFKKGSIEEIKTGFMSKTDMQEWLDSKI